MNTSPSLAADNPRKLKPGAIKRMERSLRPALKEVRWLFKEPFLAWRHPEALAFYKKVMTTAYRPDDLLDVVPQLKILYLAMPKATKILRPSRSIDFAGQQKRPPREVFFHFCGAIHARPPSPDFPPRTPICGAVSHSQKMYPHLLTQRSSGYT